MHITLARRGGFAGVRLPSMVVDTATLPAPIGTNIERLVRAAPPPSELARSETPSPDRFSFTLTISHINGRKVQYDFNETTAPSHLMALVNAVQAVGQA